MNMGWVRGGSGKEIMKIYSERCYEGITDAKMDVTYSKMKELHAQQKAIFKDWYWVENMKTWGIIFCMPISFNTDLPPWNDSGDYVQHTEGNMMTLTLVEDYLQEQQDGNNI